MSNMTAPMTIVMVDDNQDELFLTRRRLRHEGFVNNVISEKDPARLFDVLDMISSAEGARRSMIILLDLNMPELNGIEVLQKIRKSKRYKDATVLMLSSSDDEADIMDALDEGADGYIVKPFRSDEFFAALSNVKSVRYQLVQAQ